MYEDHLRITVSFQGSPVSGPRGFYVGDEVRSIGGCHVSGITDWLLCVNAAMAARASSGYCMPLTQLNKYNIALEGTTSSCLMSKYRLDAKVYRTDYGTCVMHLNLFGSYAENKFLNSHNFNRSFDAIFQKKMYGDWHLQYIYDYHRVFTILFNWESNKLWLYLFFTEQFYFKLWLYDTYLYGVSVFVFSCCDVM